MVPERLPRTVFIQIVPDLDLCSLGIGGDVEAQPGVARASHFRCVALGVAREPHGLERLRRLVQPLDLWDRDLARQRARRAFTICQAPSPSRRRPARRLAPGRHGVATRTPEDGEPRMRRHERRAQRSRVGIAGSRILGERARDDRFASAGASARTVRSGGGSSRRIALITPASDEARERPASGQHLVDDRAERRYRTAHRPAALRPVPATCRRRPHHDPRHRRHRGDRRFGRSSLDQFRQTEIENLDSPFGVMTMLAGLMSRCTMPRACAAASASAACIA